MRKNLRKIFGLCKAYFSCFFYGPAGMTKVDSLFAKSESTTNLARAMVEIHIRLSSHYSNLGCCLWEIHSCKYSMVLNIIRYPRVHNPWSWTQTNTEHTPVSAQNLSKHTCNEHNMTETNDKTYHVHHRLTLHTVVRPSQPLLNASNGGCRVPTIFHNR